MTIQEATEQQFDEAIAQANREREEAFNKTISEINAEIERIRISQADLLAQIHYLQGLIDGTKSICGEKETENAEA